MEIKNNTDCPECGTKLQEYCGNYFCSNCNRTYVKIVDDDGNTIFEPATPKSENVILNEKVENKRAKSKDSGFYVMLIVILVAIIASVAKMYHNDSNETVNNDISEQHQQYGTKNPEEVPKHIERFNNINVDENGDKYFDMRYDDFLDNYNYYVNAEYGKNNSEYSIPFFYYSTITGTCTTDNGTKLTRNYFQSAIPEQRVYVDATSSRIYYINFKIDNDIYSSMSTVDKDVIREQVKFISLALLPEMDENLYENEVWSVLKNSIIDNQEKAIAVVGKVCFFTYTSDDNMRCIRIYPSLKLTYEQPKEKLPLEKAIIGKWRNFDGSIWEYKTDGTFTIDFSMYDPEDTSTEADYLRKQDILVFSYVIDGDSIIFKMGDVQYNNDVRIENGYKYEIESVGKTQTTMRKVE